LSEPAPAPRRTLGAGATLATLSQVGSALAGGLMGIIVARLLGAAETGRFTVVLTAGVVLTTLTSLGVEVGLNYHVSRRHWPAAAAVRQSQLAALVLGLAAGAAGVVLWLLLESSAFRGIPLWLLCAGLAAVPFSLSWTYTSFAALAQDRYEAYSVPPPAQNGAALLLAGGLAIPFGIGGAVAGVTASHAAVAAGMLVWGLRAFGAPPAGWVRDSLRRLKAAVAFGFRANLSNVLQMFNYRADLFVLNAVATQADVGRYAIAVSVTALGQLMPRALAAVVMPRVAALDATAESAALEMVMVKSVRHAVVIAAATAVILAAGLQLVPFVYGSEFEGTIVLGLILIPGITALGIGGVLSSSIVGKGKPQYSLYNVLIVTPPTLALYAVLIPSLEASGAALASSLSYCGSTLIAWFYFRRATGLDRRVLMPGRDELADYRLLLARIRARLASAADSG
jgi:O-antigen/teichoic acid export membrane protein